jgi:hypothetical protein
MEVRKRILEKSPYCKFSIVLKADDFMSVNSRSLLNLLYEYKNKTLAYPDFKIDAVHFEHWNQAYHSQPSLGSYVTNLVHSMNLLVGGNTYGGTIPDQTDYIGMTSEAFVIQPKYRDHSIPAIGLISNSNPMDLSSEACAFMNSTMYTAASGVKFSRLFAAEERIHLLEALRDNQYEAGYQLAWPIFSPLCPGQRAYDAMEDSGSTGTVYEWIRNVGMGGEAVIEPYDMPLLQSFKVTPHARNISSVPYSGDMFPSRQGPGKLWMGVLVFLWALI